MFAKIRMAVLKIPKGKVSTYGAVARAAGFPGSARQVAWALHSSAGMGLPWHRVVGAAGKVLLGGEGAMEQRLRLQHEGVTFRGAKVDMTLHEHHFPRGKTTSRKAKLRKKRS